MSKNKLTAFCLLVACLLSVAFGGVVHAAGGAITVALPVEQTFNIIGADKEKVSGVFKYEMTANKSGSPMTVGALGDKYSFSLEGTADVNLKMQYTDIGEYVYTVKQVIPAAKAGYTYDKEVYTVTVYIKRNADGVLRSEVTVQRADKNKTAAVAFFNEYRPKASDPKLMTDPPVRKSIKGSPSTASAFEFKLTANRAEYPMPEGSINGVKTVSIKGAGTADFGVWAYTAAGTYGYTVSETNTGVSGYTYDSMIYTITDVVSDEGGQLKLERTIKNKDGGTGIKEFAFTNTYTAGKDGPKTGDDADNTLLIAIVCAGIAVALAAAIYLICAKKKRKKSAGEQ